MENQHRKISGYRELSQDEIDLMNEIKALGPTLEALCNKVANHITNQRNASDGDPFGDEQLRLDAANPEHWETWGRSSFQASLMYLTRAVAQPTFF